MALDHLPECREIHAPDMYREAAAECESGGGMQAHFERQIAGSEGIYLVVCADGCPHLERVRERGRQLAEEHGW